MTKPRIENAPGLVWRRKKEGWEGTWRARADLVKKGYPLKNKHLWTGEEPTAVERARISDTCNQLQEEMLLWGRGGFAKTSAFEGSIKSLVAAYQSDPLSTHRKKRFHVRKNHDLTLRRIVERYGHIEIADIKTRNLMEWHSEWSDGGQKISMAHMFVSILRTMFAFGATVLEDRECERLCGVLHHLRFPMGRPRTERLTLAYAEAIIAKAKEVGWYSLALGQALQFDLMLRQKDTIGEWIPLSEPGVSDYVVGEEKWLRGLRWSEINDNFILKHNTSKREKDLEVDLKLAPLAMAELNALIEFLGERPTSGPLLVCEATGVPWRTGEYRRKWRIVADMAGVPKAVRNMDSRAGAISEATDAGADLEHVRHAATHSDISMTQRYSRGAREKTDNVLSIRAAARQNKKGTCKA
jgi:hypothetical protein